MFSLPLYYFLYLFYAAMVVWLIVSLIGLLHLFNHSAKDKKTPIIAFIYVAVSIILTISFINTSSSIDWLQELGVTMPDNSQQAILE